MTNDHYFDSPDSQGGGEHTQMIRRSFQQVKRRNRRVQVAVLACLVLLLSALGDVALYQHVQLEKTRGLAKETFYEMKELELSIADLEAGIEQDASAALRARIAESKRRLAGMQERYDAFVREVQASRIIKLTSEDEIILHMARVFGETELDPPPDFVAEVKMPKNPRERNFWALLREHRIPKETYDYVFYIFSAAVIGENPRLFGFDFDNPLQDVAAGRRDDLPQPPASWDLPAVR